MKTEGDYKQHWDEKFKTRSWGRYPPEDLVRFIGRNYKNCDRKQISILEIGCGPGANLWFLHREGYNVAGIDGSPTAIEIAQSRLATENAGLNPLSPDLRVGDFSELPWDDNSFDVVIDIYALCANKLDVIKSAVSESVRVLKPSGRLYSKNWGRNTTGYGQGIEIETGTYDEIPTGPCYDMGVSHFFDKNELGQIFSAFETSTIDVVTRTDGENVLEEYLCQFEMSN